MLSDDERARLQAHRLAVFRERLILEAQPPITDVARFEVERRLNGPIPAELDALWSTSWGGRLDYELSTSFDGFRYACAFRELFYPQSEHVLDLWGWIDEELEAARRRAMVAGWPAPYRLNAIPIGGFDEIERVRVSVRPGKEGRVWLWASDVRLSPQISEEAVTELADNVNELFDQLCLYEDPFGDGARHRSGPAMADAIAKVRRTDPLLARRLQDLVRSAVLEWRRIVHEHAFTGSDLHSRAGRVALERAASDDDVSVLEVVIRNRYPTDVIVSGSASALALSMARGSLHFGKYLLDAAVPLGHAAIGPIASLSAHLVDRCIDADVSFDVEAPLSLAAAGKVDAALRVAGSGIRAGDWTQLEEEATRRAEEAAHRAEAVGGYPPPPMVPTTKYETTAQALRRFIHGLRQL